MGKFSEALEKAGYDEDNTPHPQLQPQGQKTIESPVRQTFFRPVAVSGSWDERLFNAVNHDADLPEVFKVLRSRILHPIDDRPVPKTILVSSVVPKEGKSFITANLGISIAMGMDQYALLVDCDLRRPSLAALFGVDGRRGVVDYLRDHADLTDLITKTSVNKLSILPSGKPPINPAELLDSSRMEALVSELSGRYDDRILIFDSPPVQIASESTVLAGQVDGVILVVRQGGGSKGQVKKVIETIGSERLIGVVFNANTTNIVERSLRQGYGYYQEEYSGKKPKA